MGDSYWRYGADARQPPSSLPSLPGKRPRSDYDIPLSHELPSYYPREDDRTYRRDPEYDRYLRNGISSYGAESARPLHGIDDRRVIGYDSLDSVAAKIGTARPEKPLPADASNTLFVEGLPAGCTRREVSHIFRPFVGFKEVRLVNKESKRAGGDPLVLCFVDFANPQLAAIAMDAIEGYKFDEHERDSSNLRLQFARFPGPRPGGGPRGRR